MGLFIPISTGNIFDECYRRLSYKLISDIFSMLIAAYCIPYRYISHDCLWNLIEDVFSMILKDLIIFYWIRMYEANISSTTDIKICLDNLKNVCKHCLRC